jgi:hypothetical protein
MLFKKFKPGAGLGIFIIFFGISTLEAFRTGDWRMIAFWMVMGIIFLLTDLRKKGHYRL